MYLTIKQKIGKAPTQQIVFAHTISLPLIVHYIGLIKKTEDTRFYILLLKLLN
jgi:hypothetical protein